MGCLQVATEIIFSKHIKRAQFNSLRCLQRGGQDDDYNYDGGWTHKESNLLETIYDDDHSCNYSSYYDRSCLPTIDSHAETGVETRR